MACHFTLSIIFNLIQTEFDYNISEDNLTNAYQLIINDPKNHKAFNQLVDRLEIYYPTIQNNEMIKILNVLSKQTDFIDEEILYEQLDIDRKDSLNRNLYILLSDHYLVREIREEKRAYKFKYQIFREWWKINKA
jgi:hypothetical protein